MFAYLLHALWLELIMIFFLPLFNSKFNVYFRLVLNSTITSQPLFFLYYRTKSRYGELEEKFTFTLALVFVQCIINAIFARIGKKLISSFHLREVTEIILMYVCKTTRLLKAISSLAMYGHNGECFCDQHREKRYFYILLLCIGYSISVINFDLLPLVSTMNAYHAHILLTEPKEN